MELQVEPSGNEWKQRNWTYWRIFELAVVCIYGTFHDLSTSGAARKTPQRFTSRWCYRFSGMIWRSMRYGFVTSQETPRCGNFWRKMMISHQLRGPGPRMTKLGISLLLSKGGWPKPNEHGKILRNNQLVSPHENVWNLGKPPGRVTSSGCRILLKKLWQLEFLCCTVRIMVSSQISST